MLRALSRLPVPTTMLFGGAAAAVIPLHLATNGTLKIGGAYVYRQSLKEADAGECVHSTSGSRTREAVSPHDGREGHDDPQDWFWRCHWHNQRELDRVEARRWRRLAESGMLPDPSDGVQNGD
jgi:hypothetical protein